MLAAAAISLFLPPIVGMLSDQTIGGIGRRRPYIAIGGLLLVMSTPLLVDARNMMLFLGGLLLLLVGKNILTPAYQSLMPDCVHVKQRGETAGYIGGMTILGNVVGLGLAVWLLGSLNAHALNLSMIRVHSGTYYVITAFFVLVGLLVTVFGVHEIPLLAGRQERSQQQRVSQPLFVHRLLHELITPWRSSDFTIVFLARASLMLGLSLFMTYIEYYFARVQHVANFVQVTGTVAALALGGAVVSGVVFGVLSDRFKRRAPVVCMATLFMCAASLTFVIFPNNLMTLLWPLGVVFGLGYGSYTSVDWALTIDVLPSVEGAGRDLGIWNASATLPAIAAPLLGNSVITMAAGAGQIATGYQLVFAIAAFFFLLAAVSVLFVRK